MAMETKRVMAMVTNRVIACKSTGNVEMMRVMEMATTRVIDCNSNGNGKEDFDGEQQQQQPLQQQ